MTFNFFVLPFFLGLIFVIISIIKSWKRWITGLSPAEKKLFKAGFHGPRFLSAIKEVFFESLLHRKMFRKNPLLGYMHMSFAFGWLLLIVLGNMESRIYSGLWINPPYYPIFLKFFIHDKHVLPFEIFTVPGFFRFSMDLVLAFILGGLVLAVIKRSRSRWFGMNKTTQHSLTDKIALISLWLIFPSRLLAESLTAGAYGYGGGFVTQYLGNLLAFLWPLSDKFLAYGFWWLYSLSLGIFFVTLPYSRYMHIPSEVLLIFFRNFGIKPGMDYSSFNDVEVYSCSRCGTCIDVCQLNTAADINDIQAVYFVQSLRNQQVQASTAKKCLICGRCQESCPVGIQLDSLRMIHRGRLLPSTSPEYEFLNEDSIHSAEVVYFAGCMTHLSPGIARSMKAILSSAGVDFLFLDEKRSICCGRPMKLAGKTEHAAAIMAANRKLIERTNAKILVTSCPICLRVFMEDYCLQGIQILHHTQYLLSLVKTGKIALQSYFLRVAYHDPCELGRGLCIYHEPRELIKKTADLLVLSQERKSSVCCGGSLGLLSSPSKEKDSISKAVVQLICKDQPEMIVTACPLCKKTLSRFSEVNVIDVAELIYSSLPSHHENLPQNLKQKSALSVE